MAISFVLFSLLITISIMGVLGGILLGEVIAACVSQSISVLSKQPASAAILIPAHNEATLIKATLENLKAELHPEDRLIVVADNCTDETATIARLMGAEVLERIEPERRGKGYALDFGLRAIASNPPDVVILIDADCLVQPEALFQLKQQAIQTQRPAQAIYLMEKPSSPGLNDQISAFAFKVKNWVRPLGLRKIGMPCPLTGTGMAFPWDTLTSVDLANGEIVEDMKLGLDLAIAGSPPILCHQAQVLGQLPSQTTASTSQRTRWEHGHLNLILRYVPPLIINSIRQKRLDLMIMALDLAIPPLSLLVMLWLGVAALAIGLSILTHTWAGMVLSGISGSLILASVLVAWVFFGQQDLPMRSLLLFPLYLLWKIPLYLRFLIKPQSQWVRTERDKSVPEP